MAKWNAPSRSDKTERDPGNDYYKGEAANYFRLGCIVARKKADLLTFKLSEIDSSFEKLSIVVVPVQFYSR